MKNIFHRWFREENGTAFTEAIILMPLMVTILMGCYDLGQGITTNQKVIGASQIMGDLIARDRNTNMAAIADIATAGELAIQPYSTASFGYDIVSIEFDALGDPVVLWRVTENMPQNDDAVESTKGLAPAGDGVIIVTTNYEFDPFFTNFVVDKIPMREVAFLKGRKSSTVVCPDCPV